MSTWIRKFDYEIKTILEFVKTEYVFIKLNKKIDKLLKSVICLDLGIVFTQRQVVQRSIISQSD